jgi:cytidylate kinase
MSKSPQVQIESQMRFREILGQISEAGFHGRTPASQLGPYVCLSRQAGSGGGEVARHLGERLGWSVLDRQLVSDLAAHLKVEPRLLALMDESRSGWWRDTLLNLMNSRLILQDSYVELLSKVVLLAAAEGKVIIVGRGAHRILREGRGLRVRVVASLDDRIERVARRERVSASEATGLLAELDRARADFIHRHFHCDVADPQDYDLTLNTSNLGVAGVTELIAEAIHLLPERREVAAAHA